MMEKYYLLSPQQLLQKFRVSEQKGLSDEEVLASTAKYGLNVLPEDPPTPLWRLVLEQFKDQLVLILLASATFSFLLALFDDSDDWTAFVDPVVILAILILNAIVGVSQESSAEKAIAALQEYAANECKVTRNGHIHRIKAEQLVPGDIVTVTVGDRIPADCRILSIQSNSFRVDQALLTGESESVSKETAAIKDGQAVKQDQINMLFSGTTVVTGHATALVVLTGTSTAIGDIQESITSQISEPTPLKQKLDEFGDLLAKVITVICILVWLINIRHFSDPSHGSLVKGAIYYLKIAVSLGVAAIPEGLAVVITTCLALGTRRMAAKNAVVRSLPSVETLGSCSVICSDKTGTLTTNQMSVSKILFLEESGKKLEEITVQGTTFSPNGDISSKGQALENIAAKSSTVFQMAEISALCNDANISYDKKSGSFTNVGEPTEGALRTLVEKIGTQDEVYNKQGKALSPEDRVHFISTRYEEICPKIATYEFSRDRKSMSVLVGQGKHQRLLVKGAPESIIERCTHTVVGWNGKKVSLTKNLRELFLSETSRWAREGLRIIALANVDNIFANPLLSTANTTKEYTQIEQNMTLVGLVGMLDPPRPEVAAAIAKCRKAGIRVIVITGDNQNTAQTICRQIGIFGPTENLSGKSYTGREFDGMTESQKVSAAKTASLFSRTEPSHKSKLVDLLQAAGEVVAMTGDGVNDAPALKKSDIGVAMGSGTDVAKLAADMVLADDNFATIELAVEEGRSIFNNTQQFIRYLISSNIGEVVSIFLTAAVGMPEALIPVQLLWVNLVTDGLPATALSFNPPDHEIMNRPPRKRDDPLVTGWLFFRYMVIGIYVGFATVYGYAWWFMFNAEGPQITFWQLSHFHQCSSEFPEIGCEMFSNYMSKSASTVSLSILVVIEMLNAMNALSSSESLLTLPLWKNMALVYAIILSLALHFALLYTPFLQTLFQILPLNWNEWKAVLIVSIPVMYDPNLLAARALTLPMIGLEMLPPPNIRIPSSQSIESKISGLESRDDFQEPLSPTADLRDNGVLETQSSNNPPIKVDILCQRPGDDLSAVEDGPLFRATMKALEQKTGNMRTKMKKVLKKAEAAQQSQIECNIAVSSFVDSLREASVSNANAVLPAIEHYFEKIAREILQYERMNTANLQQFIIDPLSKLYNIDIKQAEAKKKDFEDESRDYYAYVGRYLGQRNDPLKDKKRAESDSKYQTKRRDFELKRFDYSSFMQDLHGGRKEQEVLSQLTKFAEAQARSYLATAKKVEELLPQLEALSHEVNEADKEFRFQRTEREEKRRTLESSSKPPSTQAVQDRLSSSPGSQALNSLPMGTPIANKFKGIRDLEEKDYSTMSTQEKANGKERKEGLLWALSRPGSHADPRGLNKQAWHKFWIVLDQGKLSEYSNWKERLDLHMDPIDLRMASVREARSAERRFCFEVITPQFKRVYQSTSEEDMNNWISAINNALQSAVEGRGIQPERFSQPSPKDGSLRRDIGSVLTGRSSLYSSYSGLMHSSSLSTSSSGNVFRRTTVGARPSYIRTGSSNFEENPDKLLQLIREADQSNCWCVDCGSGIKTEWVSINLGIILCIECSGIHRSLGTHISKVRSLTLDTTSFTTDIVELLQKVGNRLSNTIWEANLGQTPRPTPQASREQRLKFITSKYVEKAFVQPISTTLSHYPNADETLLASIKKNDIQGVIYGIALGANINVKDRSRNTHSVFLALAAADPASPSSTNLASSNSPKGRPETPVKTVAFPIAELLLQNGAEIPKELPAFPLSRSAKLYIEQKSGKFREGGGDTLSALPEITSSGIVRDKERDREARLQKRVSASGRLARAPILDRGP
ncbi:MAG: hypothetical protein M1829_003044 [Trizodia sp. TS-e1964]|nr:MAG: hypothetical protein M1829_003044 [Trizodia sp. TS-e1964]